MVDLCSSTSDQGILLEIHGRPMDSNGGPLGFIGNAWPTCGRPTASIGRRRLFIPMESVGQLRISEAPPVETFIVESREAPGGVGEAGTAMIAPALVNALASANGTRIRRLPLARAGYYVI